MPQRISADAAHKLAERGKKDIKEVTDHLGKAGKAAKGLSADLGKAFAHIKGMHAANTALNSITKSLTGLQGIGKALNQSGVFHLGDTLGVISSVGALEKVVKLQDTLQQRTKFTAAGYRASLGYITQIQQISASTGGLLSVGDSTEAFLAVAKYSDKFRDGFGGVNLLVGQLNAGLGMSFDQSSKLFYRFRTLGVESPKVFRSIADSMAFFTKHTSLTTDEVGTLLETAQPLISSFPAELQKNLIPQILAVGSAFKDVGVDSGSFMRNLNDMTDLTSSTGVLMAALASSTGKVSFADIMGGKNISGTAGASADVLRSMVRQLTQGGLNVTTASSIVSKITGQNVETVKQFAIQSDADFKRFHKNLEQGQRDAERKGALEKSLSEQLETPLASFRALWQQIQVTLLSVGKVLMPVVQGMGWLANLLGGFLKHLNESRVALTLVSSALAIMGAVTIQHILAGAIKYLGNTAIGTAVKLRAAAAAQAAIGAGSMISGAFGIPGAAKVGGGIMAGIGAILKKLLPKLFAEGLAGFATEGVGWILGALTVWDIGKGIWDLFHATQENTEATEKNTERISPHTYRDFSSTTQAAKISEAFASKLGDSKLEDQARYALLHGDDSLVSKLTSRAGSKASWGDSTGQLTAKGATAEGIILADGVVLPTPGYTADWKKFETKQPTPVTAAPAKKTEDDARFLKEQNKINEERLRLEQENAKSRLLPPVPFSTSTSSATSIM